jgi:hypothetical protein
MTNAPAAIGYVISDPRGHYDTDKMFVELRNAKAICKSINETICDFNGGGRYAVGTVFADGSVEF